MQRWPLSTEVRGGFKLKVFNQIEISFPVCACVIYGK